MVLSSLFNLNEKSSDLRSGPNFLPTFFPLDAFIISHSFRYHPFYGNCQVNVWIASLSFRHIYVYICMGFPGSLDNKESACNARDLSLIPGLGRSPGKGNGYPLKYSCMENSMGREAWWATVHGTAKSQKWLSN